MTFIIGTPHTAGSGYYKNDDRVAGGQLAEGHVHTCPHCQAIIIMERWKDDGGFCRKCDKPLCAHCAEQALTFGCVPFMKRLEIAHNMLHRYSQFVKMAGLDPAPLPKSIIAGI